MGHMTIATGFALTAVLLLPGPATGQTEEEQVAYASAQASYLAAAHAVAYATRIAGQEDTIYRAARRALNEARYRTAVDLFRLAREEQPQYAADALYYQAFALYKLGGRSNYREALDALSYQRDAYPDAATRGDADELMIRVEGELARRGDRDAAERLAREAQETREDQESEIKAAALQALLMVDSDRAMPALKRVLLDRSPETAELRGQAIFILGQQESEEALDIMLDVVRNDPDPEVKSHAAFWLSQADDPRALEAVVEVLGDTSLDEEVHGQAIFALGQSDDPRARQLLKDYAGRSDVSSEVRAMAVHGLAQNPSPENAEFLKQLFDEVDEREVREQILFAIMQMPEAAEGDWLVNIATDESEDPEVRQMALFSAGQSGAIDVGALAAMYDGAVDRDMKEQVLWTLTQVDDPAAFDKMLDIARTETDLELKKAAVFWIGQSEDPRAQDVLLEILEQ